MNSKSQNWLAGIILATACISSAQAQDLGSGYASSVGSPFAEHLTHAGSASDAHDLGQNRMRIPLGRFSRVVEHDVRRNQTIIEVANQLGLVLDHSGGLPRFRGLALSPNDNVRFVANGRVSANFDDFRGQLSLFLNF